MNLKFAILGLLLDQPMHGYQLKRALSPALSSGQLLNDGVLYPLLRRMEREGLLASRVESVPSAPARNVLRPTREGRSAFMRWLRSPTGEEDEVSYDFLLGHPFLAKCLFFDRLRPQEVRSKLDAQLGSSTDKLRTFEQIRKRLIEREVSDYRVAVLDLGISQQRTRVAWLKKALATLSADERQPGSRRAKPPKRSPKRAA